MPLRLATVDRIAIGEWEYLCDADPASTFFHSAEWCDTIAATISGWRRAYLLAREHERMVAALPFMVRSRGGVRVLASMPFGAYGGVLAIPEAGDLAVKMLARRFFELASSPRVAYAEMVDFAGRTRGLVLPGVARHELEAHGLDLTAGADAVHRHIKPSNRSKARHAEHEGVTVRRARTVDDFRVYERINRICCHEWGRRGPPELFFDHLATLRPSRVEMWLAESNYEVVAGLLNFVHDRTVMNWAAVSLPVGRKLGATNLLHSVAIDAALAHGRHCYNFGANPGLPGVDAFKHSFGTIRRRYAVHRVERDWYRLLKRRRKGS